MSIKFTKIISVSMAIIGFVFLLFALVIGLGTESGLNLLGMAIIGLLPEAVGFLYSQITGQS